MATKYKIKMGQDGITAAKGFSASGVIAGLKKSGNPDMALAYSEKSAQFAATFTSCKVAAAPILWCKEVAATSETIRAFIINSGNANACTGKPGLANAEAMAYHTAQQLGITAKEVMVASTGRIGVQLPMETITNGIDSAVKALDETAGIAAAKAIMTTDTRYKSACVELETANGSYTIGAMTKGAGMIAPELKGLHATMICCITTDAQLSNQQLTASLNHACDLSFNRITIDGDMSTNDMVLIMANGQSGIVCADNSSEAEEFTVALTELLQALAREMVMDGEGVTKLITVHVKNAISVEDACRCARTISDSMLCKTAWFGADPNWGRLIAAAGRSGAQLDPELINIDYDHLPVVRNGVDAGTPEADLEGIMQGNSFTILIDLQQGNEECTMWTNDLTYEYVKINADYHT